MKYQISLTHQAESDLQSIYRYIAVDLLSPQNAAGLLERLEKSIATGSDAGALPCLRCATVEQP